MNMDEENCACFSASSLLRSLFTQLRALDISPSSSSASPSPRTAESFEEIARRSRVVSNFSRSSLVCLSRAGFVASTTVSVVWRAGIRSREPVVDGGPTSISFRPNFARNLL